MHIFVDSENAYPTATKAVNTRLTSKLETIYTNGVHPIKEGSYMVADGILPFLIKGL